MGDRDQQNAGRLDGAEEPTLTSETPLDPREAGARSGDETTLPATDPEATLEAKAAGFVVETDSPGSASAVSSKRPGRGGGERLGRYTIQGLIARGGMGEVFKGRDPQLGREVAIKRLRPGLRENSQVNQRFLEEARITGRLQHPGILPVFELDRDPLGDPFFSMKLIEGRSALLEEAGPRSTKEPRFLGIFEQICLAVAYAHDKGVIHRDLKPSNVMVGAFGEVQVLDWGLGKRVASSEKGTVVETEDVSPTTEDVSPTTEDALGRGEGPRSMVGAVMGTPAYMPPEQARGEVDRVGPRADVFALGGILCRILTGKRPFEGETRAMIEQSAAGDLREALSRLEQSGGDAELVRLAQRCLAPEAKARPADAGEVARAVMSWRSSVEERARRKEIEAAQAVAVADQERRARRLTVALATSVLVLVLTGLGAFLWVEKERAEGRERQLSLVHRVMDRYAELLSRTHADPSRDEVDWQELRLAAAQLEAALPEMDDPDLRHRAEQFLSRLERAESDRRMVAALDDLTARGASHDDVESWKAMAEEFAQVFREHGLDPEQVGADEVIRRISESPIRTDLAFGLDLWIRTETLLHLIGGGQRSMAELLHRMEWVYEADPDPRRVRLRQLTFAPAPQAEELLEMMEGEDLGQWEVSTLALLVSAFSRVGYPPGWERVCAQGLLVHPADYRLVNNCAYSLRQAGHWQEAARLYSVVTALRPEVGGLWRSLGLVQERGGDLVGALGSLGRAAKLEDGYARNHLDLGRLLIRQEAIDEALVSLDRALDIDPDLAPALSYRGLARRRLGRVEEARADFLRCGQILSEGTRSFESVTPGTGDSAWRTPCSDPS